MFNSLLSMIKTVGSERLCGLRCRQIAVRDHYWLLFCHRGSLLVAIKEDGSEWSLLVALGQQQIDLICGLGWKMEAHVAAIMEIAWKGGGGRDDSGGSKNMALIPDDRTSEGAL
ncbi:hypothetical protein BHM03_00018699 [Ensete ventricosum]|nr:hypothetical protein BHM03_00018699 [Ensete ventricosum]